MGTFLAIKCANTKTGKYTPETIASYFCVVTQQAVFICTSYEVKSIGTLYQDILGKSQGGNPKICLA
jgi:hypothetical protein